MMGLIVSSVSLIVGAGYMSVVCVPDDDRFDVWETSDHATIYNPMYDETI